MRKVTSITDVNQDKSFKGKGHREFFFFHLSTRMSEKLAIQIMINSILTLS